MPTYVIEREMPGASGWTEDQVRDAARSSLDVLQNLGCIYWAPGEDVIREHANVLGIPANRVSAVRRLMGPQTTE
jgi:hypothetical protein